MKSIVFFIVISVASAIPLTQQKIKNKFVVYPGLDVDNAAIANWQNGYTSPWNVFFGNQPYVVGWVGQENTDYEYGDSDYDSAEESQVITANVAVEEAPHDEVTEERKKEKSR